MLEIYNNLYFCDGFECDDMPAHSYGILRSELFEMTLLRFTCRSPLLQFHSMFKSRPVLGNRVCYCNTRGWRMNKIPFEILYLPMCHHRWHQIRPMAALIHRHCQDWTAITSLSIQEFTLESQKSKFCKRLRYKSFRWWLINNKTNNVMIMICPMQSPHGFLFCSNPFVCS